MQVKVFVKTWNMVFYASVMVEIEFVKERIEKTVLCPEGCNIILRPALNEARHTKRMEAT